MKRICLRSPGTMEGMVSRKKDATPSKAVLHVGGNKRTLSMRKVKVKHQSSDFQPACSKNFQNTNEYLTVQSGALTSLPLGCQMKN